MHKIENPEQFKNKITTIFDKVAKGYDNPSLRYFAFAADKMVDLAQLKPNEKVLDIACGTGMVTLAAAQKIKPDGRVHAIDRSGEMLAMAEKNVGKHALNNVDYHNMDAEELAFRSNYFDVITCGFALFFLPEPLQALKQWLRVLKPGGRIIMSTFTKQAFQPYADDFRTAITETGFEIPGPVWQQFSEQTECEDILQQAGFIDNDSLISQHGYHLKDEQEWWNIINNSGFRGVVDMLDEPQKDKFKSTHLTAIANYVDKKGLWLDVGVIFSIAKKAI